MELLGSFAGLAVVIYIVGALVMACRLHALGLPFETTLSLFPGQTLAIAGAHAVIPGLLLLIPVALLARLNLNRLWLTGLMAFPLVLGPAVSGVFNQQTPITLALVVVLCVLGLALAYWLSGKPERRRDYGAVLLVLAAGALLALVNELAPPTRLDFASVRMKTGDRTDGFVIGTSASALYLAPNVGDRLSGTITALRDDEIQSVSFDAGGTVYPPSGPRNHSLLAGGESAATKLADYKRDDVLSFLAGIRADPGWRFPPIVPADAADYLSSDGYRVFSAGETRRYQPHGPRVPLSVILADPELFSGIPFTTSGRLVETTLDPSDAQTLLEVGDPRGGRGDLFCWLHVDRQTQYKAKERVDIVATVLAWGEYNDRATKPTGEVEAACSSARKSTQKTSPPG